LQRRLAAILAADVAGYTALMGADEAGTLARLTSLRREFIEPLITENRGRVVKVMGDGLLVEFASVVDAVTCALTWQDGVTQREVVNEKDKRLQFRIGINLGDVIVEGDDIHGDGVNIATRLEGKAKPGGICLSSDAYRQAKGKVDAEFEDLGEQSLKNVAEPVSIYRISGRHSDNDTISPGQETSSASSSDKPSIAILPFTNMSGDPEQEYFSDGITEDIITELSRFRSLLVVARHSSFAFKGQNVDVKTIGRKLGVRYVVEGSVRRAGKRVRVTSQLVDTASGNHVWADRYDRDLEDIFEIQDELVRTIVATVGGRIEAADKSRASRLKDTSVPAYDLCLRAQALQDKNTKEAYEEAEQYLRKAIETDTHMAQAYHQLSLVKFWQWFVHWAENPKEACAEAFQLAQKALALDESDGLLHAHLSMLHIYRHEFSEAGSRIEQALRLNPNDTKVLGLYGEYLIAVGEPVKAIELFDTLSSLNPLQPEWITRLKAVAFMTAGQEEVAISLLKSLRSPTSLARGWLTACLANAGHLEEAHEMLQEFLRLAEQEMASFPGRSLAAWSVAWHGVPCQNEEHAERFFEGLRKAGMHE
jgi:adenylate cyclase